MRHLDKRVSRLLAGFWVSDTAVMLAMAVLVGLGGGFGAVAFRWLIETTRSLFLNTLGEWIGFLSPYHIPILTAVGGLLVGLLVHFVAPEATGPGVSSVMEAIALRGGRMRPSIIAVKPIATSITLGSGGSGGRQGPIVQIGSAIGSSVSQLARLSDERTKNLAACGAAAGIAATFNAPLAGAVFALEVLLAEFGLVQFTTVVVASVIASVIGHAYFGIAPAFAFPASAPPHTWELPIYAVLGVAAAFAGVGFTRALHGVNDLFARLVSPPCLRPAAGGLLVGLTGIWFPQILGVGYESIESVLFNQLALTTVLILGLLKIVATSITIGSGGAGGIFGPCLFIGAMLGSVVGQLVHQAMPAGPLPSTYALVGMSAVFGAASRAPITAILTIFEMTHDYNAMLPLMLSTVISAVVARQLFSESIYTCKLSRRGIDVHAGRHLNLMSTILVAEAMTSIEEMATVTPDTSLTELAAIFDQTHHHGLVVLDDRDRLHGIVSLSDLEKAQTGQLMGGAVRDIYTTNVRTAFPDETLEDALRHFGALDAGRIPVVRRAVPNQVVGMLRRGDIIRAYSQARIDEEARLAHMDQARLNYRTGSRVFQVRLQDQHHVVGRTLQELDLPSGCLIASVRRGGRVLIPRGETRLEAGDVVVALVTEDREDNLRSCLTDLEAHR
ncbi:MAG: chloride channel protein [Anaerolineae bacterium]